MTAVEEIAPASARIDYAAIVTAWSPEERAEKEKKFVRKIDYRLLPILVSPICSDADLEIKANLRRLSCIS